MALSPTHSQALRSQVEAIGVSNNLTYNLMETLQRAVDNLTATLENDPTPFQEQRARELKAQAHYAIQNLERDYLSQINGTRIVVIQENYRALSTALAREAGTAIGPSNSIPFEQVLRVLDKPIGGQHLDKWVHDLGSITEKRIRGAIAQGVAEGLPNEKIARTLREAAGLTRKEATTVTRTTIMDATSKAREQVYRENRNLIKGYQYLATLDSRTCPVCAPWDGVVTELQSDLPKLPAHPSCRCVHIPLTRFSEPTPRPKVTDETAHKVHHRDGSTSTKYIDKVSERTTQNYGQFFREQPAEWQRTVLGPARYELWKSGTPLEGFAKDGHVLSLSQLKASSRTQGRGPIPNETRIISTAKAPILRTSPFKVPDKGRAIRVGQYGGA